MSLRVFSSFLQSALVACGAALLIHRVRQKPYIHPFATIPREIMRTMLKYFTMYEVARLQRLVCREFRDAGQERIRERGGRKLFEEGLATFLGNDYKTIDKPRGHLLLQASRDAGCKIALIHSRIAWYQSLSDEDKQKILTDLKEISTSSPYHWVYYYIGDGYRNGWGGEEKKNLAVVWLEKAAHKGNAHALCDLGVRYENGDLGLTQSATKANELFALAADKGCAQARYNLGCNYREGTGDLAIDFNRCVELLDQSATQGILDAQYDLGEMYHSGSRDGPPMTIPVDPQLSFRWSLAAAQQEHMEAMKNIGLAYYLGRGVEQNMESALEWFLKAAEKGDESSQCLVGDCFETGKGCEIDLDQAMHWYQKSAAQGFQQSIDAVQRLA